MRNREDRVSQSNVSTLLCPTVLPDCFLLRHDNLGHVIYRIFEKSQFAVNLTVDDLNEQNATDVGFSSRMHMHRDETQHFNHSSRLRRRND